MTRSLFRRSKSASKNFSPFTTGTLRTTFPAEHNERPPVTWPIGKTTYTHEGFAVHKIIGPLNKPMERIGQIYETAEEALGSADEMPGIHLDMYIVRDSEPLVWRFDDLARALEGAQFAPPRRPVIVEGILLLRVLQEIGRVPDFHVFVDKDGHEGCMQEHLATYFSRYRPTDRANYVLRWSSADHDARVLQAHHLRRARP
jgi:hypothetical protein